MIFALDDFYRDEFVADISDFVRIPSRSSVDGGEEGALQSLMASRMKALGASVRTFEASDVPAFFSHPLCHGPDRRYEGRPTVIAEIGPEDAPALLILAHSDTVQIAAPDEWTVDPFSGEVRDGAVWGLGSTDDKWGLAAMLVMLRAIRDSAIKVKKRLIFASTIDEENGIGNGTLLLALAGIKAESALYLDGYAMTVFIGNLGGSSFCLSQKSPIEKARSRRHGELISKACERLSAERSQLFDRPYYRENWARERSVLLSQLGMAESSFLIAFYTLPGEERAVICRLLEETVAEALGEEAALYEMRYTEPWFEAAIIGEDTPIVRCLSESVRNTLKSEPAVTTISKQDSFVLTNHAGIPTVSFGGRMQVTGKGSFHNPDEHMPIDEAWTAASISYAAVCRWLEAD